MVIIRTFFQADTFKSSNSSREKILRHFSHENRVNWHNTTNYKYWKTATIKAKFCLIQNKRKGSQKRFAVDSRCEMKRIFQFFCFILLAFTFVCRKLFFCFSLLSLAVCSLYVCPSQLFFCFLLLFLFVCLYVCMSKLLFCFLPLCLFVCLCKVLTDWAALIDCLQLEGCKKVLSPQLIEHIDFFLFDIEFLLCFNLF